MYDPATTVLGPGEKAPVMTTAEAWFVDYTPQMSYDNVTLVYEIVTGNSTICQSNTTMCYVPFTEADALALLGMFIGAICFVIAACCVYCWWKRKVAAFEKAVNDKIMGAATDALGMGEGQQQQPPPQTQMMPMGQPGLMQPMPHMGGMPMGAHHMSSSTTTTTTSVMRS